MLRSGPVPNRETSVSIMAGVNSYIGALGIRAFESARILMSVQIVRLNVLAIDVLAVQHILCREYPFVQSASIHQALI